MKRSRLRTVRALITGVLAVTALVGCAGLPVTGPVNAGPAREAPDDDRGDIVYLPDGPAPGASPEQIIEGFLAAGAGPREGWATAREYLAVDTPWDPQASVTVHAPGNRALAAVDADDFTVTVTPEARVDQAGAYSPTGPGSIEFLFRVARQSDGEWRITRAPDGIVLDRNRFGSVFSSYPVMYFDPSYRALVPDRRWYPTLNSATRIAEALIDGTPSPWLDDAVDSAFSGSVNLAQPSVPVRNGVAQVSLSRAAATVDEVTRNRMQTQLEQSLASAGITDVQMLVDGEALEAEAVATSSLKVDPRALLVTEAGTGFTSGDEPDKLPSLSEKFDALSLDAIELNGALTEAAVRGADGTVLRVPAQGDIRLLDERDGLVAPSIDPFGYIWSVPKGAPTQMRAYGEGEAPVNVSVSWPAASQVTALRVSRDGARVAAIVREGSTWLLVAAGIERDRTLQPVAVGEYLVTAALPGPGVDLSWVDGASLVAVADAGDEMIVREQTIGGTGTDLPGVPDGVATITGGNQSESARVLDTEGVLFEQRGSSWQRRFDGVQILVHQQGELG